jgi:hypothetical protein
MPKLSPNTGLRPGRAQIPNAQIGFVPSFFLCEPLPPSALSAVNRRPNQRPHSPNLNIPNHFREIGFVPSFRHIAAPIRTEFVSPNPSSPKIGFVPSLFLCEPLPPSALSAVKSAACPAQTLRQEIGFVPSIASPQSSARYKFMTPQPQFPPRPSPNCEIIKPIAEVSKCLA